MYSCSAKVTGTWVGSLGATAVQPRPCNIGLIIYFGLIRTSIMMLIKF